MQPFYDIEFVCANDYAPFGEIDELRELDAGTGQYNAVPNATPADLDTVFGYHGRAYDPDSGLGHHAARWYDPHSGRFLSEDPIAADVNPYRFAGNDPINYGDPSGLVQAGHPLDQLAGGYSGGQVRRPSLQDNILNFGQIAAGIGSTLASGFNTVVDTYQDFSSRAAAAAPYLQQRDAFSAKRTQLGADLQAAKSQQSNRYSWNPLRISDQRQIERLEDRLRLSIGLEGQAGSNYFDALAGNTGNHQINRAARQSALSQGARGLGTGSKAVVNSAIGGVTLGAYDNVWTVNQFDLDVGYNASRAIAGVSSEILIGVGTGGLSRYGRLGKAALAYDTLGNGLGVGRGLADVYQQGGLTFGNSLQIVGGTVGLGGNAALGRQALGEIAADLSRVRVSFDTATLSANGLGGVRFRLAPVEEAITGGQLQTVGKRGAGVVRPDRHHIFPQEHRSFFQARGVSIDDYLIPLDAGTHSALHFGAGGGYWNKEIIQRINDVEASSGSLATPRQILREGARLRRDAGLQHVKLLRIGQ